MKMSMNRSGLEKLLPFFEGLIEENYSADKLGEFGGINFFIGYDGMLRSDVKNPYSLMEDLKNNYDIELKYMGIDKYNDYVFDVVADVEDNSINEQDDSQNFAKMFSDALQNPEFQTDLQQMVKNAIESNKSQSSSEVNVSDRDPTKKGLNLNSSDIQRDLSKIEAGVEKSTEEIKQGVDSLIQSQEQQAEAFKNAQSSQSKSAGMGSAMKSVK